MKNFAMGVIFFASVVLAGAESRWFPLPNLAGLGVLAAFGVWATRGKV